MTGRSVDGWGIRLLHDPNRTARIVPRRVVWRARLHPRMWIDLERVVEITEEPTC